MNTLKRIWERLTIGALVLVIVAMAVLQPHTVVQSAPRFGVWFGTPEAVAAGIADVSLGTNGATNAANITTALNALPSQGGLFHFKVGSYNISSNSSGNITRAFGNMTIEGEGKGTLFTGNGTFVPGGSNWVIRDLAFNFLSSQLPQNATWNKVYTLDYPNGVSKDANGVYTVLNITATQVTATTGNITNLNAQTSNLTGLTTVSNITARDATVVVATSGATPAEKAIANFVLTGTNDEVVLMQALNSLPEWGLTDPAGVKTGTFKVIGSGTINIGSLLDFPPLHNANIDFPIVNIFGAGVRFDSMMNVEIRLPLLSSGTNTTQVEIYPRTPGPDFQFLGSPVVTAVRLRIASLAGTNVTGIKFNNSANASYGDINNSRFIVDEIATTVTTWISENTSIFGNTNKIDFPLSQSVMLGSTVNTSAPGGAGLWTAISNWNFVMQDPSSLHAGSNITIKVPGFYQVSGWVTWNTTSVDQMFNTAIRINGSTYHAVSQQLAVANQTQSALFQTISILEWLNAGDTLELVVGPRTATTSVIGGNGPTMLTVTKVDN